MAKLSYVNINDILPARNGNKEYDPYKAVAAGICFQAFCDLKDRYAGKKYSCGPLPEQDTLERFFRSDRYRWLSGMDNGEQVIEQAKFRGEYERFRSTYKCKTCKMKPKECIHREGKAWDLITENDIYCRKRRMGA